MKKRKSNQLVVPGVKQAVDEMKTEIAQEFGMQFGPNETSRTNSQVDGKITKKLIESSQQEEEDR